VSDGDGALVELKYIQESQTMPRPKRNHKLCMQRPPSQVTAIISNRPATTVIATRPPTERSHFGIGRQRISQLIADTALLDTAIAKAANHPPTKTRALRDWPPKCFTQLIADTALLNTLCMEWGSSIALTESACRELLPVALHTFPWHLQPEEGGCDANNW
jgi:hypothetical protein